MTRKPRHFVRSALPMLAVLTVFGATLTPASAEEAPEAPPGQLAFEANKCNLCHAVEIAGIEARTKSQKLLGPDQSEVGSRHELDWIKQFLNREVMLDEKQHKKEYKGTPEDLELIADWLVSLTSDSG